MAGMGQKRYEYRVYNGVDYQGLLSAPSSDFSYTQTINTVGVDIIIDIPLSFQSLGAEVDADLLVTETGDNLVTEVNYNIATRLDYVFNNAPLELANRIVVVEFCELYPNGQTVFDGILIKWNTNLAEDKMQITAFSYGYQLAQYIISESGDLNIEQVEYDGEETLIGTIGKEAGDEFQQSFSILAETDIDECFFYCRKTTSNTTCLVTVNLYEGLPDNQGALLASVLVNLSSITMGRVNFNFGAPITLAVGDYFFDLLNWAGNTESYSNPIFATASTNPYADGAFWINDVEQTGYDLAFGLVASSGSVLYPFSNIDSGSGVRQAMAIYASQGGVVQYDSDTVETTGVNMYYDFNTATVKEIIDKSLSVSPASYFYYVDVGTNTLYFKDRSITYDHLFKRGYDLTSIAIERTIDEMQNTIYFSGGDLGAGENLLILSQNLASVNNYGRWTGQLSDNRVTVQATAEKFAQATLDANSEPKYRLVAEVLCDKYDTSTIKLGDMIKILNNGNLIDELLLQVVEMTVKPYSVILKLGSIQPRTSNTIERLSQQLTLQEKENNPDTIT